MLKQEDKASWFKSVFDAHYDSIRRFLYFRCGDVDLSEDIAQEVFIKLWDVRDTIREESVLKEAMQLGVWISWGSHIAKNKLNFVFCYFVFKIYRYL